MRRPPESHTEAPAPDPESVLAACESIELREHESLAAAELASAAFLIVRTGVVAVSASCEGASRRMVVAVAQAGEALPPPRASEQLVGLTAARIAVVPGRLSAAVLAWPGVAALVVAALLEAVSDRQRTIANFAAVAHDDRLRAKLVQLAGSHGRVGSDGIYLDLPLTHELLAQTIGSARETVTGALGRLEAEGFLVREGPRLRLAIAAETCDG